AAAVGFFAPFPFPFTWPLPLAWPFVEPLLVPLAGFEGVAVRAISSLPFDRPSYDAGIVVWSSPGPVSAASRPVRRARYRACERLIGLGTLRPSPALVKAKTTICCGVRSGTAQDGRWRVDRRWRECGELRLRCGRG